MRQKLLVLCAPIQLQPRAHQPLLLLTEAHNDATNERLDASGRLVARDFLAGRQLPQSFTVTNFTSRPSAPPVTMDARMAVVAMALGSMVSRRTAGKRKDGRWRRGKFPEENGCKWRKVDAAGWIEQCLTQKKSQSAADDTHRRQDLVRSGAVLGIRSYQK